MYKVTWTIYGRYHKEQKFDNYADAKGFFYGYCVKSRNITRAELKET